MPESFDAYYKWLGISPKDQPPNHYRLLGIELFDDDPDVIEAAADQRMAHVRTYQTGPNSALSQKIRQQANESSSGCPRTRNGCMPSWPTKSPSQICTAMLGLLTTLAGNRIPLVA
jgi:hypothetical protein